MPPALQKSMMLSNLCRISMLSVEHLLIGIIHWDDQIGKLLKDFGLNEKDLESYHRVSS